MLKSPFYGVEITNRNHSYFGDVTKEGMNSSTTEDLESMIMNEEVWKISIFVGKSPIMKLRVLIKWATQNKFLAYQRADLFTFIKCF